MDTVLQWIGSNALWLILICFVILVAVLVIAPAVHRVENDARLQLRIVMNSSPECRGYTVKIPIYSQEHAQNVLNSYVFHRIASATVWDPLELCIVARMDSNGRLLGV